MFKFLRRYLPFNVSKFLIDSDFKSNNKAPFKLSFKSFLTTGSLVLLIALNTFSIVLGLSGLIKVLNTCSGSSKITFLITFSLKISAPSL